jgi:putative membrane protein
MYAYTLVWLSEKGWIEPSRFGKAGASLLGVLSMGECPLCFHFRTIFTHPSPSFLRVDLRVTVQYAAAMGLMTVTGLLISYRFSTALSKWDEGKKVWVGIRSDVRQGIRMVRYKRPIVHPVTRTS